MQDVRENRAGPIFDTNMVRKLPLAVDDAIDFLLHRLDGPARNVRAGFPVDACVGRQHVGDERRRRCHRRAQRPHPAPATYARALVQDALRERL